MFAMAQPPHQEPTSMDYSIDALTESMSRMLVRGDKYGMDTSIRSIVLEETWAWPPDCEEGERFLDASCLLFDAQRQLLSTVDFNYVNSCASVGSSGAVAHSGDILRTSLSEGTHSITVELDRLSPHVNEIFITLSAWASSHLGDILRPTVSMVDPHTGRALCHYELEKVSKEDLEHYTSVIMCRVYRTRPGQNSWEVEALGQLGMGNASNYSPMVEFIQQRLGLSDILASWRL